MTLLWKFSENASKLMQKHSNQDMVGHGLLESMVLEITLRRNILYSLSILPGGALSPAGLDLVFCLLWCLGFKVQPAIGVLALSELTGEYF